MSQSPPQGVITYADGAPRRIYAFPLTGNITMNYWNGSRWLWENHGTPPSGTSATGVITYKNPSEPQRIYAFFSGTNGNGNNHLYAYYWDGAYWRFADQGGPAGTAVQLLSPAPITYKDPTGVQRIHVYVVGQNGRLYSNIWDGSRWVWADHGPPPGTTASTASAPAAVTTYKDGAQRQWIHAFVTGSNGRLYVNYWDGSQYRWADQDTPPGTTVSSWTASPAAVTYKEGAQPQRIYAFVLGDNRRLYVNYWDGSQWRWRDQGTPPGPIVPVDDGFQAITYKDLNQPQRIYAFVRGLNGRLYANYWDGSQWRWADQGAPPGGAAGYIFGAVTFQDTYYDGGAEPRQIYVHVGRLDPEDEERIDRYFVNHWNGYQWLWEETGPP